MSLEFEIVEDPARACSAMLLSAMLAGGDVVVTGGETPRPAYEELAKAVRAVGHDLRETTLWFSDERCVTPDSELSNYRLVKQSLLGSDPDPAGGRVVTYAGWPLYTFVSDTAPGSATGQGLNINGGPWYVLSPSGQVIFRKP